MLSTANKEDAESVVFTIGKAIKQQIKYQRRSEKGVQSPLQTLKLATGSCRDMATLMMEALRCEGNCGTLCEWISRLRGFGGRECIDPCVDGNLFAGVGLARVRSDDGRADGAQARGDGREQSPAGRDAGFWKIHRNGGRLPVNDRAGSHGIIGEQLRDSCAICPLRMKSCECELLLSRRRFFGGARRNRARRRRRCLRGSTEPSRAG